MTVMKTKDIPGSVRGPTELVIYERLCNEEKIHLRDVYAYYSTRTLAHNIISKFVVLKIAFVDGDYLKKFEGDEDGE